MEFKSQAIDASNKLKIVDAIRQWHFECQSCVHTTWLSGTFVLMCSVLHDYQLLSHDHQKTNMSLQHRVISKYYINNSRWGIVSSIVSVVINSFTVFSKPWGNVFSQWVTFSYSFNSFPLELSSLKLLGICFECIKIKMSKLLIY